MMTTRTYVITLSCFVLVASAFLPLAAQAEETFTAGIARVSGPTAGRDMPSSLIMTVEKWSTEEERANLLRALKEGGEEAVLEVLGDMDKGYLRYPASTGWPINHAWSEETEDGRIVRLVTERPILFNEAYRNTRTFKYKFGIVELRFSPDGKSEGTLVPTAMVSLSEDGDVEVKMYGSQAHQLLNVTSKKD